MTCCKLYGYTADFSFIGFGPKGTEHLGACTQMAVFTKIPNRNVNGIFLNYQLQFLILELLSLVVFPSSLIHYTSGSMIMAGFQFLWFILLL